MILRILNVAKADGAGRRFLRRLFLGFVLATIIILVPCSAWSPDIFTWVQVPLAVLFLVIYLGVLLYDTLFFDHYD